MDSIVTAAYSYLTWLIGGNAEGHDYDNDHDNTNGNGGDDRDDKHDGGENDANAGIGAKYSDRHPELPERTVNRDKTADTSVVLTERDYGITLDSGRQHKKEWILTSDAISTIHAAIPPKWRLCTKWTLLYSTQTDGFSLHTLYHSMRAFEGAVLLVIKERNGPVFGCFVTEPIVPHPRHFGSGESFLFAYGRDGDGGCAGKIVKYGAVRSSNDYYVMATGQWMAVGCGEGRFGVWVDERLCRGSSHPVPTFNSPQLSRESSFVIEGVEVWGLPSPRSPVI